VYEELPPQILFIERCFQLMKDGGRIAIVLPDGVLGGEKLGYIANYMKTHAKVVAIIDLPIETFAPMVTTKTHLLILEKTPAKGSLVPYSVFMAVATHVGHDRKGRALLKDDDTEWDELPFIAEEFERLVARQDNVAQVSRMGYLVESKWLEDNLVAKRYLPEFMEALKRVNDSPLSKKSIKQLGKVYSGANVASSDYTTPDLGIPYILVNTITPEGINCADLKYVSKTSVKKFKNAVVRTGDIVVNRCGTPGIAAIVPSDLHGAIACGFVFRLVLNPTPEGCDPNYLVAFINGELGRKQTKRLALGSILQHITKPDLQGVRALFPEKQADEQGIANNVDSATKKRVESRALLITATNKVNELFKRTTKKPSQSVLTSIGPSVKGK
jgi:type I restriction enzyme M protein